MPDDHDRLTARLARAYNLGLKLEKSGDKVGAADAYRQCLALDPGDQGGVAMRLAAMGLGPVPDRAPPAYVATLFDQHAEVFDDILVEQLGYAVPMQMRERLDAVYSRRFARMLDLGCGTGLAGVAMRDRADDITGVDLSDAILGQADERDVYDDLYVGDAVAFAAGWDEAPFDLVTATDVLPYLGALDAFFAGVVHCLAPTGLFAFSSETLPDAAFDERGYTVGPHQRFHHRREYVEAVLHANGMTPLAVDDIVVRSDEGAPQHGHLFVARRDG
jgi:predicted TPR repeat methyltransferase